MRLTLATLAAAALAVLPSSTALPLSARQLTPSTAPLAIAFQDRSIFNLVLSTPDYECAPYVLAISGGASSFPVEVVAVKARSDGRPNAYKDGEEDKVLAVVARDWTDKMLLWDPSTAPNIEGKAISLRVTDPEGRMAYTLPIGAANADWRRSGATCIAVKGAAWDMKEAIFHIVPMLLFICVGTFVGGFLVLFIVFSACEAVKALRESWVQRKMAQEHYEAVETLEKGEM
ncbi:hypothetical protein JCM10213_007693 [Rhodosporidiobolus nylandii]